MHYKDTFQCLNQVGGRNGLLGVSVQRTVEVLDIKSETECALILFHPTGDHTVLDIPSIKNHVNLILKFV